MTSNYGDFHQEFNGTIVHNPYGLKDIKVFSSPFGTHHLFGEPKALDDMVKLCKAWCFMVTELDG